MATANKHIANSAAAQEEWKRARWREVAGPLGIAGVVQMERIDTPGQTIPGIPGTWDPATPTGLTLTASRADGVTVDGQQVDGTVAVSAGSELEFPGDRVGSAGGSDGVYGLRVWDECAPAIARLRGIATYPLDPGWIIDAEYRQATAERFTSVQRVTEPPSTDVVRAPGDLVFELDGHTCALQIIETFPGQRLVVFTDATSGTQTPSIGRWLILPPDIKAGGIRVDFNRVILAHHTFAPVFPCPLPPVGNHLPLRVEAGERAAVYADN